jgi:HEPN domain-containing protein
MSERNRAEAGAYWLELAKEDLRVGDHLAAKPSVPQRAAAYFAHQAAEKALKAAVAIDGAEPPRTHDLVRLAHLSSSTVPDQDLRILTDAHIQAQYPDPAAPPYDTTTALALLETSSRVVAEVQGLLAG